MKRRYAVLEALQRSANSAARRDGCGSAAEIVFKPTTTPYVYEHIRNGWRKKATGEYVCNAYRNNFGWKNTYYEHARTTVAMPLWAGWMAGEDL